MKNQPIQTISAAPDINPASFRDAAQCREWLARIACGDPGKALEAIRDQLRSFLASEVLPAARVAILETLREPVANLQAASAPGYCDKAIPFAPKEHDLWRATVDVRLAMAAAYEQCLTSQQAPAQRHTEQWAALICQRALRELDLAILDHARAYIAVPGEIWKRLHGLYRHAEVRGITETAAAGTGTATTGLRTCRSTYLHALLFDQAQPYSRTPLQMESIARWLDEWAALVSLQTAALDNPLTALVINLDSTETLKLLRHTQPGSGLRHVDTQRVGEKLKGLALALRQGTEAAKIGLATDLAKSELERLLTDLYIQWCSAGNGRASARTASSSKAMVTLTIPAMHFYISGRAFRQPGQGPTREEEEDLQTFGHISLHTTQKLVSQRSSALEPWSIANESASGMLALCRAPDFRTRIVQGQLLGLMKRSDKPIELVTVQRLMLLETGELAVGARRIEGIPQAAAARIAAAARPAAGTHTKPKEAEYQRALLVPAIPEKSLPPRLFLPPRWCEPQCSLDLYVHEKTSVRVLDFIKKGPNFEQVTFESVVHKSA